MDELLEIKSWIQTLDFSTWDDEDEQMQWVNARDMPSFDSQWMRVFTQVRAQEEGAPLSDTERDLLTQIRREGFVKARQWDFVGELADYAADDFDLIARAARLGFTDFWLDKVRREYEEGRFPHGAL